MALVSQNKGTECFSFKPIQVNTANHLPWARITKAYTEIYKTGKVEQRSSDLIIWEYRQHPKDAIATNDTVPRPTNADWVSDEVSVWVFDLILT